MLEDDLIFQNALLQNYFWDIFKILCKSCHFFPLMILPVFASATPVIATPSSKRKLPLESGQSFGFSNKKRRSIKKNLGIDLLPNTMFSGTSTPGSGIDGCLIKLASTIMLFSKPDLKFELFFFCSLSPSLYGSTQYVRGLGLLPQCLVLSREATSYLCKEEEPTTEQQACGQQVNTSFCVSAQACVRLICLVCFLYLVCVLLSFSELNLERLVAFLLRSAKKKHHASLCACALAWGRAVKML